MKCVLNKRNNSESGITSESTEKSRDSSNIPRSFIISLTDSARDFRIVASITAAEAQKQASECDHRAGQDGKTASLSLAVIFRASLSDQMSKGNKNV